MALDPRRFPWLGVGLGHRRELAPFIDRAGSDVQVLELMPEHVLEAPPEARPALLALASERPVVTHSVSMSIGSAEGPDAAFLAGMRAVSDAVRAPWASDHLCFTRSGGRSTNQLLPLPYTDECLDVVVRNVKTATAALGRPLALENVTRYFAFKGEDYSEPEFFSRLAEEADALLLLDVTNVRNNARNLGLDARALLDEYPLERAIHLHVAGTHDDGARTLDTHAGSVPEEVWALTERALDRAPARALVIERDDGFDDLAGLPRELARARDLMARVAP